MSVPAARSAPPYKRKKGRKLGRRKNPFNLYHAKVRALGEQGADARQALAHPAEGRCSPSRLTAIVQSILTHHQARWS